MSDSQRSEGLVQAGARALSAALLVGGITALMWVVELFDVYVDHDRLDRLGIQPRDVGDLPDIFTAPFVHAGIGHMMGNTVPFLVLGFLAAVRGIAKFLVSSLIVIVVGGLGVWFTSPANTLGSSILIFGFFGYLVGRGLFERRLADIVIAVGVVAVYGTMLVGVIPDDPAISWQGHLFGLIGGVLGAWFLRRGASSDGRSRPTPPRHGASPGR
ncbi:MULTISPECIES: rhomboid family intramembrane serine protease [Actinomadura]|uniref:Rhomboid family intramembrane serine protease n=1 Tax=Actinomadura litoris TaxID=2678616 RepID=A0A7K1L1U0_9ACTN|nr:MULTISPECIES: rhomboid family intramembrane serine protease [Actinomadura]MBT2206665.1 rhomboid family intramembrane serine protease [Actinomadura sp. NEAU-AAG7]MUN38235.1 rhomboid family intramembrane serine protease [Actinomadura litoris]